MQEKPKKIFMIPLLIGIVILIFMNMSLSSRIADLERGISHMQFNHFNEMRNIQWEISQGMDRVNEQITQLARISFDEMLNVLNYDRNALSADVEIAFNLKEFNVGDVVSVTARSTSGQTHEAIAELSEAGRFSAIMTLPVQDNFVLNFTARGDSVISGNLMDFNLANMLCDRFRFSLGFGMTSVGSNRTSGGEVTGVTLLPYLSNDTQGNSALEIRDITLLLISGGNVTEQWDLLPYLTTIGGIQSLDILEHDTFRFEPVEIVYEGRAFMEGVLKLVMHDNLGIRYEQMEEIPFFRSMGEFAVGGGRTFSFIGEGAGTGRVISYGEESWHFVHMVRMAGE